MDNLIKTLGGMITISVWHLGVAILAGVLVGMITILVATMKGKKKELPILEVQNTVQEVTPEQRRELDHRIITREMYSIADTAKLFGVNDEAVRVHIRKGELKFKLVNNAPYVEAKVLKEMIDNGRKL